MATKSRDTAKVSGSTDLPARKPRKHGLADRVTRSDFGNLETRPAPPPLAAPKGRKLMADRGPSDDVDLPSSFSVSGGTAKRR